MRPTIYPNAETITCISLSSRPSNFGMTIHNAAYHALGLNFFYKAFATTDLVGALAGVRALGIRGCSVSMPFKEKVLPLLDVLDPIAESLGAINTIVNNEGQLSGYNTDAYGAEMILRRLSLPLASRVLILGAGGVARAILYALKSLGYANITISNRSIERLTALPVPYSNIPWSARNAFSADIIINTTPLGMAPNNDDLPINEEAVSKAKAVIDVIVTPSETPLIKLARALGKAVVCGHEMSLHQAARQFELYTGKKAPLAVMEDSLKNYLKAAGKMPK